MRDYSWLTEHELQILIQNREALRRGREEETILREIKDEYFDRRKGRDFIGVGVGAIIVNEKGELFVSQRGEKVRNQQLLWEFPGGGVELWEKHCDALIREMREELGVQINVVAPLNVVDDLLPAEGQHWISPNYVCEISQGTPEPKEKDAGKVIDTAWKTVDQLDEMQDQLTKVTVQMLEAYKEYLKQKA